VTRHTLLRTNAFVRTAKRMIKRHPDLADDIAGTLHRLEADPHQPSLKTHKLTGELADSWACSAGYDLRIIFRFTRHAGKPAILLETIGTHDEVVLTANSEFSVSLILNCSRIRYYPVHVRFPRTTFASFP